MRKRSGWAVLLAVAGVVLGGAFAVRLSRRKPTARPAPPGVVPAPPPAPKSDASRQLVRMAIGAAIVVVLSVVIVVVTRPSGDAETTDRTPARIFSPVDPPPVDRFQKVVLDGLNGAQARVGIERIFHPGTGFSSIGGSESRSVQFEIGVTNTGGRLIGVDLDDTSWVMLDDSETIRPDRLDAPASLSPGALTSRHVAFIVPVGARMIRLHVGVPMDGGTPGANWNL